MASRTNLVHFSETIKVSRTSLRIIGLNPWELSKSGERKATIVPIVYYGSMWNLHIADITYLAQVVLAFFHSTTDYADMIILLPCLSSCILSECKVVVMYRNRHKLQRIFKFLSDNFPTTLSAQESYDAKSIVKKIVWLSKFYAASIVGFIWSFNLLPLFQGAYDVFIAKRSYLYRLPYVMIYPFDYKTPLMYTLVNLHLFMAGNTVGMYYIGGNTILFSIVRQISMHLDNMSKRLEEFQPGSMKENSKFLADIVKLHNDIIEICDDMNDIFAETILGNFIISACVLCMLGLRILISGFDSVDTIKLVPYLLSTVAEIYLICSMGDRLTESSLNVAQAAFGHNWMDADPQYRKSIILITQRAQKEILLKASHFSVANLQSFKAILSTSYQLFAVMHTTYSN